ncbi:hypothetical protein [Streptomyces sp. NPDC006193]|uniref:hypothetical protein n=1 Tax=Streptomyces sp. NPDC006193 TaxID=3155717 RepID=UPI0033B655A9
MTMRTRPAGLLLAVLLSVSACAGDADPEEGDSTYKPENDVTVTQLRVETTAKGRVAKASYRIRNDGPDPLTYTVVLSFLDTDGNAVTTRELEKRVGNDAVYEGTLKVPWSDRSASSGARVTDVSIR